MSRTCAASAMIARGSIGAGSASSEYARVAFRWQRHSPSGPLLCTSTRCATPSGAAAVTRTSRSMPGLVRIGSMKRMSERTARSGSSPAAATAWRMSSSRATPGRTGIPWT